MMGWDTGFAEGNGGLTERELWKACPRKPGFPKDLPGGGSASMKSGFCERATEEGRSDSSNRVSLEERTKYDNQCLLRCSQAARRRASISPLAMELTPMLRRLAKQNIRAIIRTPVLGERREGAT
jgi:hypothetical protein